MRWHQQLVKQVALGALLSICVWRADAQEREALFRASTRPTNPASAVASVVEPAGGQYVYSSERSSPRPTIRFAIGKAPRTDYAIFSAEEQHELDLLRERGVQAQKASAPPTSLGRTQTSSRTIARATRKAAHPSTCEPGLKAAQVTNLAWPKVVQQGDKVCVPKLDFAGQPDWRDHVWCFDKGDGSVR